MKHSDFTSDYHWMNGLDEYFKINRSEKIQQRWSDIYKALYQDNWYRKRDIMIELCGMPDSNPVHVKSWMNLLLKEHLDVELKPQLVATLLRKYMNEDPLLVSLVQFIHYWSGEKGEAASMPDIGDFLSRGQVKSKIWLIDELKNIGETNYKNVVFYGGWYNFVAHFLFSNFNIGQILSVDVDQKVIDPSKRLYPAQTASEQFVPIQGDVSQITWEGKTCKIIDPVKRGEMVSKWTQENQAKIRQFDLDIEDITKDFGVTSVDTDLVINTSCEHMDNTWYENLPEGTLVCLHTNDYFDNPQHSNCCEDQDAAAKKYPMNNLMYKGTLDTVLYKRFMLIGRK